MRKFWGCLAAALFVASTAQADPPLTPAQQAEVAKLRAIQAALHPQYGDVKIPGANATLHLGKDFYYLPPDEARRVLVDAWENSPKSTEDEKGLIFPAGKGFLDDSWAAVVTYTDQGYVSDSDAKSTDYDKMIQSVRDGEGRMNEERKSENLVPIHVVGWATPPFYDQAHHTLVWARELQFGDQTDHTVNYDLRALGRGGVLSMNIISTMSKMNEVKAAASQLQNVGTFDPGARYTDYKEGVDKKAEYGVAGLVAAAIGVAAAKKLGLLAVVLLFAKKGLAFIVAGFAAAGAWFRKFFTRKKTPPPGPTPLPGN
ncbi:MAG TPA: DUF2167 domain-containing protein [Rhizomicrobium sp.]|jgi:uncharacterized membrane-anchored protein